MKPMYTVDEYNIGLALRQAWFPLADVEFFRNFIQRPDTSLTLLNFERAAFTDNFPRNPTWDNAMLSPARCVEVVAVAKRNHRVADDPIDNERSHIHAIPGFDDGAKLSRTVDGIELFDSTDTWRAYSASLPSGLAGQRVPAVYVVYVTRYRTFMCTVPIDADTGVALNIPYAMFNVLASLKTVSTSVNVGLPEEGLYTGDITRDFYGNSRIYIYHSIENAISKLYDIGKEFLMLRDRSELRLDNWTQELHAKSDDRADKAHKDTERREKVSDYIQSLPEPPSYKNSGKYWRDFAICAFIGMSLAALFVGTLLIKLATR